MIRIRELTAADVPQIASLEQQCFRDPWHEASIASELDNPLSLWLVAADGEQIVGYVGSQTVMGETDMMNLAVHPGRRREGIGRLLIERLIPELNDRGSHCLTLEVRASNSPAQALYEKMGFHQTGLRKNYYRNPKEDAIILRKEWRV